MLKYFRCGIAQLVSAGCAVVFLLSPDPAKAYFLQYDYYGSPFDFATGLFDNSDRVVGSFIIECSFDVTGGDCSDLDLSQDLTAYVDYRFEVPGVFSTSDYTNDVVFFSLETDSSAKITDWAIYIGSGDVLLPAQIETNGDFDVVVFDPAIVQRPGDRSFANSSDPGFWTPPIVTPLPATWTMLFAGGALFGWISGLRRKDRKRGMDTVTQG